MLEKCFSFLIFSHLICRNQFGMLFRESLSKATLALQFVNDENGLNYLLPWVVDT